MRRRPKRCGMSNESLFILLSCLLAAVLFVMTARALLFVVEVEGKSMTPALQHGDRALTLRFWPARWLRRGQIVVTRYPDTRQMRDPDALGEQKYIKRIAGLPDDTVVVERPNFSSPQMAAFSEQSEPRAWHIPPGHYFVLGDSWGLDSSVVGPIPFHALCGVVIIKLKHRESCLHQPVPPGTPSVSEQEKL